MTDDLMYTGSELDASSDGDEPDSCLWQPGFKVEEENGDVAVKAFRRMVSSSGSSMGNIEYAVDIQESGTDTLLAEASFLDGTTFEVPGLVFSEIPSMVAAEIKELKAFERKQAKQDKTNKDDVKHRIRTK